MNKTKTKRERIARERSQRNTAERKRVSRSDERHKINRAWRREHGAEVKPAPINVGGYRIPDAPGAGTARAKQREAEAEKVMKKVYPNILTREDKRKIALDKLRRDQAKAQKKQQHENLSALTKDQLQSIARDNGIKGFSKLNKADLVKSIEKAL